MPTRRAFFRDIFSGLDPQTGVNAGDRVIVVPANAPPKLLALSDIGSAGAWSQRNTNGNTTIGSTAYTTEHSYGFSVPSDGVYLFLALCTAAGYGNPSSATDYYLQTQFQAPDGTSVSDLFNCAARVESAGGSHTHSIPGVDHRHYTNDSTQVLQAYNWASGTTGSGGSGGYPDQYMGGTVCWSHVMDLVAGTRTGYVNCRRSSGTWSYAYKTYSEMTLIKLS